MVVLPVSNSPKEFDVDPHAPHGALKSSQNGSVNWLRVSSAATLVTSGALLLAGKHRLGLVVAATGTSLAMIDQQDSLKKWWSVLPGYIAQVQGVLSQVEKAVDNFAEQREKIGHVIGR
jgi:hypothetical protein